MNRSTRSPLTVLDPSGLSRRRFLLLSAGSLAAVATGCGGGQGVGGPSGEGVGGFTGEYTGPALTLDYWNGFTGGDGPAMKDLVSRFNSEQENITIKSNTIEWPDFYSRLPAAAQAGQGPDVGAMHLDQIATHAATNIIVPVDDVAEALGLTEEDFAPAVWGPGIYKDQRYGIPLDVHCLAMYYNQDHFDEAGITEPPTDAATLQEAMDKLQQAGHKYPFWMPNLWPAHLMFLSLLWQFGGEPYSEDGSEATFGSEAGVAALSWMKEQIDKGYSPTNVEQDAQYTAFKNEQNSITWDGIWQINDLEASGINWGIAPLPVIGDQLASWANSHNFFLTAQAAEEQDRADASKVFIGWMSEQSAAWSDAGMIPALNSARDSEEYQNSPQSQLGEQVDQLHFLPAVPGLGAVQVETLEIAVNESILGRKSVAEALSEAQGNASELMQDNLEKFGG
jgi:multiple sugar transport system substrate-binding protein